MICGEGCNVTSPPSPTMLDRPNTFVDSRAAIRVAGSPAASRVASAPLPCVRSFICSVELLSDASTVAQAPEAAANVSRYGEISTAMIRAPISAPNIVAASPTGPWPNTASTSLPEILSFFNA